MPTSRRRQRSPFSSRFSWRLVKEELERHLHHPPRVDTAARTICFSPLSLYVSASMVRSRCSLPSDHPFAIAAELQPLITRFFRTKGLGDSPDADADAEIFSATYRSLLGPAVSFSNSLWIQKELHFQGRSPISVQAKNFFTSLTTTNFDTAHWSATENANAWLHDKFVHTFTQRLIPHCLVNKSTAFIVGNVLSFDGEWAEELTLEPDIELGKFETIGGSSILVPFMKSTSPQFIQEYNGFKVCRLPFKRGVEGEDERSYAMYVFLPNDSGGLLHLLDKFIRQSEFLNNCQPKRKKSVGLFKLPIGSKLSMTKAVGLPWPIPTLIEDIAADPFSMTIFKPHCFSRFLFTHPEDLSQKSKKKIDQGLKLREFPECSDKKMEGPAEKLAKGKEIMLAVDFVADRPFLFAVKEEASGCVLMVGLVDSPTHEECVGTDNTKKEYSSLYIGGEDESSTSKMSLGSLELISKKLEKSRDFMGTVISSSCHLFQGTTDNGRVG